MEYGNIGTSALNVSRICFGCMSLGNNAAENKVIVESALDDGVNFFDTADLYEEGENEVKVGKLLREHRHKVKIATKVGNQSRGDGSGWDWNPRKDYILKAVEGSLRRLQVDAIDLYQLHGGTIDDPIDETIEAFEILKDQGKIVAYGISSIRPNVIREYVKRSNIVSVMMQYSLLDRRPEEECFGLLGANNISVLARGSLAQGLLIDKAAKPYLDWSAEKVAEAAAMVRQIAGEGGSKVQTAVAFALQHQPVTSAVMGFRTLSQVRDITGLVSIPPLSAQQMESLSVITASQYYSAHR